MLLSHSNVWVQICLRTNTLYHPFCVFLNWCIYYGWTKGAKHINISQSINELVYLWCKTYNAELLRLWWSFSWNLRFVWIMIAICNSLHYVLGFWVTVTDLLLKLKFTFFALKCANDVKSRLFWNWFLRWFLSPCSILKVACTRDILHVSLGNNGY